MIYECEQCEAALPPGALACPKCGEVFEEPVPQDATIRKSGWKSKTEEVTTLPATPLVAIGPNERYPDYILPDEEYPTSSLKTVHANQHSSYWSFTALGILLWPVGLIIGIVFLTKSTLLERKLGEHTLVMSLLGLILSAVLSPFVFGNHPVSFNSNLVPSLATPALNSTKTSNDVTNSSPDNADSTVDNALLADGPQLEKGSEHFTKEYNYDKVNGEVKNISSQSFKDVEAVTTFYDGSGNVVKTTSAMLQLNPILPGQTSPYETMDTDNPEIKTEKTIFSVMMGGSINFRNKTSSASPSDKGDLDKAIVHFRSRLNLARNNSFNEYVLVSEQGETESLLNLTMTPDFSLLSQSEKHEVEYHLWHLWHHVSGKDGASAFFNDAHNKLVVAQIGLMG